MKKFLILVLGLVLIGGTASALVGPEPDSDPVTIIFKELNGGPEYDRIVFDRTENAAGFRWDFRDREAYRCADMEGFVGDELVLRLEFEQETNYDIDNPPGFQINDRGGVEHGDGSNPPFPADADPCGTDVGGGPERNRWLHTTEDHFPHYLVGHTAEAPVTIYVDGLPVETLDLRRDQCNDWYWTPGDEPGEVVGWQDPDGPTHNHPGSPVLPCNGGENEPFAALRGFFILESPRAGVCIADELDGDRCFGLTSPPEPEPTPTATPSCGKRGCDYTPPPKN